MNRLRRLIREQIAQGGDPHRVALSLALGITLGAFPLIGFTTLLCLAAGVTLRLNQPLLQAVNYAMGPVQLLLIPAFGYIGARMGEPLTIDPHPSAIISSFSAGPVTFLRTYGELGLRAVLAWSCAAPLAGFVIYKSSLRILSRGGKA